MGILIYRDAESGHKLLGKIDYEIGIRGAFQYDDAYLAYAQSRSQFGISERLPLDARPYASNEFAPFFSGLLPEGEILADLATHFSTIEAGREDDSRPYTTSPAFP